jgi:hypothetical protein
MAFPMEPCRDFYWHGFAQKVNTKRRVLSLGDCQLVFEEVIDNDGRDIPRFRDHALRLFNSAISIENTDLSRGEQSRRLLSAINRLYFGNRKIQKKMISGQAKQNYRRIF